MVLEDKWFWNKSWIACPEFNFAVVKKHNNTKYYTARVHLYADIKTVFCLRVMAFTQSKN